MQDKPFTKNYVFNLNDTSKNVYVAQMIVSGQFSYFRLFVHTFICTYVCTYVCVLRSKFNTTLYALDHQNFNVTRNLSGPKKMMQPLGTQFFFAISREKKTRLGALVNNRPSTN